MRTSDAILVIWIMIISVIIGILSIFSYPTSGFTLPNIFQPLVEPIPLDTGWVGFIFILVNGFLLSLVLSKDGLDMLERLVLSMGLGFGATYVLMILVGILWKISLSNAILVQTILLVISLIFALRRGWRPNLNRFFHMGKNDFVPSLSLPETAILFGLGVYMFVALYQTVAYPAIEWDSLAYGVNYAKIILEKGAVPLIAGPSVGLEMSASYPPGIQMLAVYFYVFAGNANDFYFRILQPILGVAVITATYKFAMTVTKNKKASFFAILTLSAMPTFWQAFVQETYLMCLTLMLLLSSFFFFKAHQSKQVEAGKYETIGTVFCCFSALTSYVGIFSFGLLFLYAVKRRMPAKRFAMLMLLAFVIVSPWYLRNLILLGNPLYPFFGIGYYLDSTLLKSTVMHFQNWSKVPFYSLFSTISRIGAGLLTATIVYLLVTKRKLFFLIFPSYILLMGLVIMATHIPFIRYLVIAMPLLAVILSESTRFLLATPNTLKRITPAILIILILALNVAVLPIINSYKPAPTLGDDKWSYLIQVFEEGDAWKWINENTPRNARIATYDIKEYYIDREVLPLDGNESAPLYRMSTIEEGIDFLKEKSVSYFLSVPWATPSETRIPPAYEWSILTRYLGDPRYLPPVFVGWNGTTVYHVGSMEEDIRESLVNGFAYHKLIVARNDFVPPIRHVTVNLTLTSNTSLNMSIGKLYLPIPADYRYGNMTFSVNSPNPIFSIQVLTGMVSSKEIADPTGDCMFQQQHANVSGEEYSFQPWNITKAGYFTLRINGNSTDDFNVTLDLRFYNYFEFKSPLPLGIKTSSGLSPALSSGPIPIMSVPVNNTRAISANATKLGLIGERGIPSNR